MKKISALLLAVLLTMAAVMTPVSAASTKTVYVISKITSKGSFGNSTTSYTYNSKGFVTKAVTSSERYGKNTTTYSYNSKNQITQIKSVSPGFGTFTLKYKYKNNLPVSVSEGNSVRTFTCNKNGLCTKISSKEEGYPQTYTYNKKNQLTKVKYPSSTVTFTYDKYGYRTKQTVKSTSTNVTTFKNTCKKKGGSYKLVTQKTYQAGKLVGTNTYTYKAIKVKTANVNAVERQQQGGVSDVIYGIF